ncbi:MAG TPA: hypothetical protein VKU85_18980 [bacterium]|nr:hypothetical protein [bacterium]
MSVPSLVGVVLIAVALLDLGVGLFFIVPRAPEPSRMVLRLGFVVGAFVMLVLGSLFLTGTLGGSS